MSGIPDRTCRRRLARLRLVNRARGRGLRRRRTRSKCWRRSTPASGRRGGHRKIAAMMRADGHVVSTSTVERALRRCGLLLPRGYRAVPRSWAKLRRRVFRDPPTVRNRVWQTDLSEFETTGGGIWRICAVIDYATKYCLAVTVTPPADAPPDPTRWVRSDELPHRLLVAEQGATWYCLVDAEGEILLAGAATGRGGGGPAAGTRPRAPEGGQ
jgi:transposase InsO family protein